MTAVLSPVSPGRQAIAKPLYAQVRDLLLARVKSGEWGAGETLPNEFLLAKDFDVSIGAVRRAAAELETGGVLVREQGRGTYVAAAGTAGLAQKFTGLRLPTGERMIVTHELVAIRSRPAGSTQLRFGQHLYPLLAEYGAIVIRVEDTIGLTAADTAAAQHLGVAEGAPLLCVERVAFSLEGRRIEIRSAR